MKDKSGTEEAKWVKEAEKEKNETEGNELAEEKNITQEMRQEAFDNYETTDDHGMVIVGVAKDQNDRKYFKVKNSWNTDQIYEGYFYASEPYVLYKTTSFLVNKNAIPKSIKNNLNIK
ncbi:MAG: C1 family peptidase [Barnesiella sp.]